MKKTIIKAWVAVSIAIALFSAGVTILSTYAAMANACNAAPEAIVLFGKHKTKPYVITEIQPCKGKYYVQLYQFSGKKNTKYNIYVKQKSQSNKKWKKIESFKCKNGVWTAKKLCFQAPLSAAKYVVKIEKNDYYKSNPSKVKIRFILK